MVLDCSSVDDAQPSERLGLYVLSVAFGGGNGNPHQYSYLENPMDKGTWWATVHGVTNSWIRLKWPSTLVDVIFLYFYHLILLLVKLFILKGIIQKVIGELDSLAGRDLEDNPRSLSCIFFSNYQTEPPGKPQIITVGSIFYITTQYTHALQHTYLCITETEILLNGSCLTTWAVCKRASFSVSSLSSSFFILFSGPLFFYSFHPILYSFKFSLVFSIFFIFSLSSLFILYSILFYKC